MRDKLLTLVIILCVQGAVAQETEPIRRDQLLFEKGLLLQSCTDDLKLNESLKDTTLTKRERNWATGIKRIMLQRAIEFYQELIDSFPKSELLFRALTNKGFAELDLNKTYMARNTFELILNSKADDKEKGGVGSGLMAEPYANYKNQAAKILADICIKENNYRQAIQYLDLTKKYPYIHFCGNEYAANSIYMSKQYARCYLGLKDTARALKILLPHLLGSGLANNSELVTLATEILLKKYPREELKNLFINAFKTYTTKKVKSEKFPDSENYYITFLDTEMEIINWQLDIMEPDKRKEEIENMYKRYGFYKRLNEY